MQNQVGLGSIVTIIDKELEEENRYRIVSGNKENENDLSSDSALGKALIGRKLFDVVIVKADVEYEVEIIAIDNSNIKINSKPVPLPVKGSNQGQTNKLIRNLYKGYGTRAQAIYDECCGKFGWDYTKRGLFAPQKPLYAAGATPEGYSPLFLAHSNWTETKAGNMTNVITNTTIEEKWDTLEYDFYHDKYTCVVFAKSKKCQNNYVFIGVYKPVAHREEKLPNGQTVWVKVFERISDEYGV